MKPTLKNPQGVNYKNIVKGVFNAYLVTLFLFLILGAVLYFTKLSENVIPSAVIVVSSISILTGAMKATKDLESLGWFHGGIIGFLYMGLLIILSILFMPSTYLQWNTIIDLGLGFIIGAIAGMLGMNL